MFGKVFKKSSLSLKSPKVREDSSLAFRVPEASVPSLLDSLTTPSCQLHTVQDTGPKVGAGHRASEARGLRIMRSQTWSGAVFSSVKWASVINCRTQGSNVSETLGNSTFLGEEGVWCWWELMAIWDLSWGLEQEGSASVEVGRSAEPSKSAPLIMVRKCPWCPLSSFKILTFRMWHRQPLCSLFPVGG